MEYIINNCLNCSINVIHVDTNGHPHQHVLWSLGNCKERRKYEEIGKVELQDSNSCSQPFPLILSRYERSSVLNPK